MGLESVPETMMACQVMEFNQPYKIHKVPTPRKLGEHGVLVKVAVASLCHTDGMVQAGIMGTALPCTASHEGTGTVVAVGSAVTKFKEGDRIMCGLFTGLCGVCSACTGPENYMQYCSNNAGVIGVHINGCFADYVVCDDRTSQLLPDKISYATAAPLACAGITVWRGVLEAELVKGQWIAFVGSGGGLGHLGIQFAKAMGLNVIGIDARDEGLALSKECGADVIVDARKGDDKVVEEVHKATNGAGADATVNVSDAKGAAGTACKVTKRHGKMIQIAQPETVDIPFFELVFRDVRVKGSLVSSPDEARLMLQCVADNNISVKTNMFNGLEEIPKLLELAHGGKMKGKGAITVDAEQVAKQRKDVV